MTRHVESVITSRREVEARAVGWALAPSIPRIGWFELWRRSASEPVVWHAHRNLEVLVGLLLRRLGRSVRVVSTRHASTRPSWPTRWLAARVDRRVALTRQVADALVLPAEIVSHGAELTRFSPPVDRKAAWDELGLGGSFGVGVIGRVRESKGVGDFAQAISPLLNEHPDWRALAVGAVRPGDAGLAKRVAAAGVQLLGERPDPEALFAGLTVLVHPSHAEAYSMVLLEAMASGCCVVASALPHVPDVVADGVDGFLYPPGDVEALRALLDRLMRRPEVAREVGERAARSARERLGIEHEVRALEALYEELASGLARAHEEGSGPSATGRLP